MRFLIVAICMLVTGCGTKSEMTAAERAEREVTKVIRHGSYVIKIQNWPSLAPIMLKNVELDSFIISATPYDELREYYANGKWSKQQFANAHILFFEQLDEYDYVVMLFDR